MLVRMLFLLPMLLCGLLLDTATADDSGSASLLNAEEPDAAEPHPVKNSAAARHSATMRFGCFMKNLPSRAPRFSLRLYGIVSVILPYST